MADTSEDTTHVRIPVKLLNSIRNLARLNNTTTSRQIELALCKHLDIPPSSVPRSGARFHARANRILDAIRRCPEREIRTADVVELLGCGRHQAWLNLSRMVNVGLLRSEVEPDCGGRIVYLLPRPKPRGIVGDIPKIPGTP